MFNEFSSLEGDAAERIISLFPPKDAEAAADRISLLQGQIGLAIALVIADFDPLVGKIRRRQEFNLQEFKFQLIGRLGLAGKRSRLQNSDLLGRLEVMFNLDA